MSDGFYIGSVYIYYYGIIIMAGVVAALWLAIKEAKYRGLDSEIVWDVVPWLLIAGIIGARLWHVFTPSKSMGVGVEYYLSNPIEILKIRKGGLGIPGALLGGIIALIVYCHVKKLNFFTWADVIIPGVALAQAIGRWGNFINQELYGAPTDLPWAIHIDEAHRLPEYAQFSTYHPLFLYESLWNLMNMYLLLVLERQYKDKLLPGDLFLVYLIVYPFGRFFLEFLRLDISTVGGVNINQITMLALMVIASTMLIIRHKRVKEETVLASEEDVETIEKEKEQLEK